MRRFSKGKKKHLYQIYRHDGKPVGVELEETHRKAAESFSERVRVYFRDWELPGLWGDGPKEIKICHLKHSRNKRNPARFYKMTEDGPKRIKRLSLI